MDHQFALAFVAGIIMGGAAIQELCAQTTPPTHAVVDISGITDPERYQAIHAKSGAAVASFGDKFIVATEKITAIDGTAPQRFIVIKFDNPERKGLAGFSRSERGRGNPERDDQLAPVSCRGSVTRAD